MYSVCSHDALPFCTGHTDSLFDTDFETGVLSVTLEADEDLVCTYTNIVEGTEPPPPTGTGSLTIVKAWDGGAAGSATFAASDNLGDDDNSFVLDGTATQVQFNDLADGNYVVDEADAAGWAVSSIVCTGGTNSLWDTDFPTGVLSVNLVDDEDLTCTFTNMAVTTPPTGGSLTINKAWVGGAAAPTTFTTSANLGDSDNSVVLDGTTASVVFPNLANGGMYVVTESTPAGWSITDITCTGATDSDVDDVSAADAVAVTLANNENVVCTFTNTAIEGTENPVQNVPDVNDVDSSTPDNGVGTDVPSFNLPSTNVPPANVPSGNVPQSNDSNAVSNAPAPSSNIPSIELPSSVSNQAPSGPVSNVAGQQAPLPPSAGNAQGSASNTPIALFASLAVMVGALAATTYGLRRR
jgi:hypothetical protein